MSLFELVAEKLSDSVIGYYHLWQYLDAVLRHHLAGGRVHYPTSASDLYEGVLSGRVVHGDRVKLREFQFTEWVPRLPGGVHLARRQGRLSSRELGALGDTCMYRSILPSLGQVLPPFGSVRLPLQTGKRVALGAIGVGERHVDEGVVISVTAPVYSEYLAKRQGAAAVEGTVDGFVELFDIPRELPDPAIFAGAAINVSRRATVVVTLDSPLQVKFRRFSSHPWLHAWAVRQLSRPTFRTFDFLYATAGNSEEELSLARRLLRQWTPDGEINEWVPTPAAFLRSVISSAPSQEVQCVTDYDSRIAGLDPLIPLSVDPRQNGDAFRCAHDVTQAIAEVETESVVVGKRHDIVVLQPTLNLECEATGKAVTVDPYPSRYLDVDRGLRIPPSGLAKCPYCDDMIDFHELREKIEAQYKRPLFSK